MPYAPQGGGGAVGWGAGGDCGGAMSIVFTNGSNPKPEAAGGAIAPGI